MDARFLNDVFVKEVGAGGHQRHGVQRAASQMRELAACAATP
jgi:hypothetical protein